MIRWDTKVLHWDGAPSFSLGTNRLICTFGSDCAQYCIVCRQQHQVCTTCEARNQGQRPVRLEQRLRSACQSVRIRWDCAVAYCALPFPNDQSAPFFLLSEIAHDRNHAIGHITLLNTCFGVFATQRVVAKSHGRRLNFSRR
jgi:hypothetical protein